MTSNFNAHSQSASSLSPQEIELTHLSTDAYSGYSDSISSSTYLDNEQTCMAALDTSFDAGTVVLEPQTKCSPQLAASDQSFSGGNGLRDADEHDVAASNEGETYTSDEKFLLLSAFLDDEVTEAEQALVIGWINSDPQLQRQYREQMKLREAMRSMASKSGWEL
ncbi:MAG: hypothetical protein AAFS06_16365 [Cyanobacteria bacterium J06631_12]